MLAARAGIAVFALSNHTGAAFGAGLRAGLGVPILRLGGGRLEAEVTGGGGVFGTGATSNAYGEARAALVGRLPIADRWELIASPSVAAVWPGGFALALAAGIGLGL
jgi:hypothetical protein